MILLAVVVTAFHAARSLYVCASMLLGWRWLRSEGIEDATPVAPAELDALIPALREQAVMRSTLGHYAALAAQWPGLRVWIVTAEREELTTAPGDKTTDALSRELVSALNAELGTDTFRVISYPGAGRRASQLNFALMHIGAGDSDYVAIFDADARPDSRLRRQYSVAVARHPAMMQQLQLPAYDDSANVSRSCVMSGQDLFAFRRVLGIELRRIRLARWCRDSHAPAVVRALVRPMVYGIGSGLLIRRDHLDSIGQFQEPHDDLAIGHRTSLAGDQILVLPSVNIVEPYRDVASMAMAFSSVAFGNAATLADYRFARRRASGLTVIEQRLLLWRALTDGVLWAVGPILVLAALAVSALSGTSGVAVAALALLVNGVAEPVVAHRLRRRVLAHYRGANVGAMRFHQTSLIRGMSTYLVQPAVTATGPWLLAWRWITATAMRRPIAFSKTARLADPKETGHG